MGLPVPPTLLRLLKTLLGAEKCRSSQLRDPPHPSSQATPGRQWAKAEIRQQPEALGDGH